MARKRARNEDGHYIKDDPTTPNNEAWVEQVSDKPKKASDPSRKAIQSRAPAASTSSFTNFISSGDESSVFDLRIGDEKVRGSWAADRKHVFWKVRNELVEVAMQHHHVWSGRIISTKDD